MAGMKSIAGALVVLGGAGLFGAIYVADPHTFGRSPVVMVPLALMVIGLVIIFRDRSGAAPEA